MLLDLSNEILLKIIAYLFTTTATWPPPITLLWPLSLSCKRLNACCGCFIFKKYHLCIRTRSLSRVFGKCLTPLCNSKTMDVWDLSAVKARLHHLREKGPYVRELVVEDWKDGRHDGPGILPECIIPDLLDALRELSNVTIITFDCGSVTLPLPLWEWITTKDLTKFSIGNFMAPPPNAMSHPSIREFDGGLYEESMPFLEV